MSCVVRSCTPGVKNKDFAGHSAENEPVASNVCDEKRPYLCKMHESVSAEREGSPRVRCRGPEWMEMKELSWAHLSQ